MPTNREDKAWTRRAQRDGRREAIRLALENLRTARTALVLAGGFRQTLPKLRAVIKSAEGAQRHAWREDL